MSETTNTGTQIKFLETDDIHKVPFASGQYIIVDTGDVYYDPTHGKSIDDRIRLNFRDSVIVNDLNQ